MNNKEKFTTWSSKSKVYRENSETISSCPVKFFTDVLFPSLVSFAFFFFENKKIHSDTHSTIWAGEW